ncbi:MAG: peptidoglycan DD-metalloendopeptidase family protein [Flavobacteriales bacterium]
MKHFFRLSFVITLFLSGFLLAQNKKVKLQAENKKLRSEIKSLNSKLSQNKKEASTLLDYVQDLEQKIKAREKIIQNIAQEKNILQTEIQEKQNEVQQLKNEIDQLKKQYKQVLINSYKRRNETNPLLFILSADNFSQMYRRFQYIKTYGNYRKKQVNEINEKEIVIQENITVLEQNKKEKETLLAEQKKEKEKVNSEKKEQQQLLVKLDSKKNEIIAQIKVKEIRSRKVQNQIEAIIKEEIRIAREKAAREARLAREKAEREARLAREKAKKEGKKFTPKSKTPSKTAEIPLTKEARVLASNFVANKGKLPWPVEKGRITQGFGKQQYPGFKNIYVNNNGIDIDTNKGASSRAVFSGKVSAIISIPGGNKAILVQHGNYFSVYNNLEEIYVSKGQKITTKQSLGKVYTDSKTGKTTLNFQIWKNSSKQNPTYWIHN